jgi:hypothetical protein
MADLNGLACSLCQRAQQGCHIEIAGTDAGA